ncbi:MAG: HD domain-containing protein [Nanoarchaeota archaeon]|nr:HD domain-containing protein [Nanoarchaeota archaeon]
MNEKFYEELRNKIKPYFDETGSHSFDHTERVYNLAVHIANSEKVDIDVVKVAVLLHDIARKKQDECGGKICHAEEGSKIAKEILKKINFPVEKINPVCDAIVSHRYSTQTKAKTKEAEIIQDADRLDALGAITIARIFDYGGRKKRKIHDSQLKPKEYTHNSESESSFIHFYEKILKIKPETFKTIKAKEIARERYKFVKQFVERFEKEWKGEL